MLAENPRVIALRDFVASWHLSYLSADTARGKSEAGGEERLSSTGDNLANVIQYLHERHPERLDAIFHVLRQRVPRVDHAEAVAMADGSLVLRVKDAPFGVPVLSRFASDGTLKMLAYLTLLHDPVPPRLIGVEEPENFFIRVFFQSWRKSVALPANVLSFLSRLILRLLSRIHVLRKFECCGETSGDIPTWSEHRTSRV